MNYFQTLQPTLNNYSQTWCGTRTVLLTSCWAVYGSRTAQHKFSSSISLTNFGRSETLSCSSLTLFSPTWDTLLERRIQRRRRRSILNFNELHQNALQSVVDDRGILFSVFHASAKGWSLMSAVNKCSSNLFIEAH